MVAYLLDVEHSASSFVQIKLVFWKIAISQVGLNQEIERHRFYRQRNKVESFDTLDEPVGLNNTALYGCLLDVPAPERHEFISLEPIGTERLDESILQNVWPRCGATGNSDTQPLHRFFGQLVGNQSRDIVNPEQTLIQAVQENMKNVGAFAPFPKFLSVEENFPKPVFAAERPQVQPQRHLALGGDRSLEICALVLESPALSNARLSQQCDTQLVCEAAK